jgi:competence protein ComEA
LALAAILISVAACAADGVIDVAAEESDVAGEQATGAACAVGCHGWEAMFDGPRQPPQQWDYIISDMVARGAQATEEELNLVRRFLKREWGTVWINSAPAQDVVAVLGLPGEDADAIVAYREEHGAFSDLESLKKVPGIDAAVIDAQAEAITFN